MYQADADFNRMIDQLSGTVDSGTVNNGFLRELGKGLAQCAGNLSNEAVIPEPASNQTSEVENYAPPLPQKNCSGSSLLRQESLSRGRHSVAWDPGLVNQCHLPCSQGHEWVNRRLCPVTRHLNRERRPICHRYPPRVDLAPPKSRPLSVRESASRSIIA